MRPPTGLYAEILSLHRMVVFLLPCSLNSRLNRTLPAQMFLEEAYTHGAELSELTSKSCDPKPHHLEAGELVFGGTIQ